MRILVQNSSDIPIYQQVYEQIKEHILTGKLTEGELLPSIRQLSRELKVSIITTTRAYTDLEKDGFVMIVQGKGCYVNKINQEALNEKLSKSIEEHFYEIRKCARLLKMNNNVLLDTLKHILEEDLPNE